MMFVLLTQWMLIQEPAAENAPIMVDRVALKVNDKIITERELMLIYAQRRDAYIAQYSGPDLNTKLEEIWEDVVKQAKEQLLLYEKSVELGLSISQDAMESRLQGVKEANGLSDDEFEEILKQQTGMTMDEYVDSERRNESAQRVVHSEVFNAIEIDDSEVAKYYSEHQEDFVEPPKYRVAEIVLLKDNNPAAARIKALACLDTIKSGTPFVDAARQYSDSASRDNGGDLGEVQYGDLHYVIEDAVRNLEVNDVSELLEADTAYFIIKILNKRDAKPIPIDDVEDRIKATLREPRVESKLTAFLQELEADYLVDRVITKPDLL